MHKTAPRIHPESFAPKFSTIPSTTFFPACRRKAPSHQHHISLLVAPAPVVEEKRKKDRDGVKAVMNKALISFAGDDDEEEEAVTLKVKSVADLAAKKKPAGDSLALVLLSMVTFREAA